MTLEYFKEYDAILLKKIPGIRKKCIAQFMPNNQWYLLSVNGNGAKLCGETNAILDVDFKLV
jgi:hypothetical protein